MLIPPANLAGFFCLIAHLVNEFTECAIKQKQHKVLWYQHNNEKRGIRQSVAFRVTYLNSERGQGVTRIGIIGVIGVIEVIGSAERVEN